MLKLTYTEAGLHMEYVAASLDVLVAQRVILALRFGQTLHLEPGRASFLLPADTPGLPHLELALYQESSQTITVTPVDNAFVEVSLYGSWIAVSAQAHEGMFVTVFSDRTEFLIYKLWQVMQVHVSSLA